VNELQAARAEIIQGWFSECDHNFCGSGRDFAGCDRKVCKEIKGAEALWVVYEKAKKT
jgi:hypothetical protein